MPIITPIHHCGDSQMTPEQIKFTIGCLIVIHLINLFTYIYTFLKYKNEDKSKYWNTSFWEYYTMGSFFSPYNCTMLVILGIEFIVGSGYLLSKFL